MRTQLMAAALLVLSGTMFAAHADDATPTTGRRGNGEFRKRILEKFDKNGDGKLDEQERAAAKAAFQAKHPEFRQKMLARFDKNGDGKLDEQERAAAKAALEAKMGSRKNAM